LRLCFASECVVWNVVEWHNRLQKEKRAHSKTQFQVSQLKQELGALRKASVAAGGASAAAGGLPTDRARSPRAMIGGVWKRLSLKTPMKRRVADEPWFWGNAAAAECKAELDRHKGTKGPVAAYTGTITPVLTTVRCSGCEGVCVCVCACVCNSPSRMRAVCATCLGGGWLG
jgi:hypothetical protein